MIRFSASLEFLWPRLSLPDAVRAAARAGFDGVECHFPYAVPPADLRAALGETGLAMIGINAPPGDLVAGDFGLAAIPGRADEARRAIDEGIAYAAAIGARHLHVMAGRADGLKGARDCYLANLAHAADAAAAAGLGVVIEAINRRDAPGYLVAEVEAAAAVLGELDRPNLRLMFDCYHVQVMQGDVIRRLEALMPLIGHVQIASVPDRAEPDGGELALDRVVRAIGAIGYDGFVGAEYRPASTAEAGLGWLAAFREALRPR